MSNRVANLFPSAAAAAPAAKTLPPSQPRARRAGSRADETPFEHSLKKAKPKPAAKSAAERADKQLVRKDEAPVEAEHAAPAQPKPADRVGKADDDAQATDEGLAAAAHEQAAASGDELANPADESSTEATMIVCAAPTSATEAPLSEAGQAGEPADGADVTGATRPSPTARDHVPSKPALRATQAGPTTPSNAVAQEAEAHEMTAPVQDWNLDDLASLESPMASETPAEELLPAPHTQAAPQAAAPKLAAAAADSGGAEIAPDLAAVAALPEGNAGEANADADQASSDGQQFTLNDPQPQAADDPVQSVAVKADGAESFAAALSKAAPAESARPQQPPSGPVAAPALPAEQIFSQGNHPQIISSIRQELLPHGGTMQIRLDPPELGAMQVTVQMRDGVITASFQTSSDEATRLLSHSLHQLKQSLESQGVSVDRMHVQQQQAPREADVQSGRDDGQQQQRGQSFADQQSARQEQQRREMMQRLWRRLSGSDDFVDLVA